jgi:hypothetical protein
MLLAHPSLPWITLVALADVTTNSAGAAPCPSMPHYNDPIGASEAPFDAPPSAAIRPDDTNADASLIDDHLSECTQESHLSACTAETHVSVITAETHVSVITDQTHVSLVTEGSMLNTPGPLPVAEETTATPSWDEAGNPESISVKGPAQYAIVALTSNETHNIPHDSASRSPMVDSDNPERIRLSAVTHRAAAGLGGDTGSSGPPTVSTRPFAEGDVGEHINSVNPMNHCNTNPNDGNGFGSNLQHAHINYVRAPTVGYAPATSHDPSTHDIEQDEHTPRDSNGTTNAYFAQASRVDRCRDSPFNQVNERASTYHASDNADAENTEHFERSQSHYNDIRDRDRDREHVPTYDNPPWDNLYAPYASSRNVINRRMDNIGKSKGNGEQIRSRLRQLALDNDPGINDDLDPERTKVDYTGRSPNRLQQLVRDASESPTRDTNHTSSLPRGLPQLTRDEVSDVIQADILASRLQQLARGKYPRSPHSYEPGGRSPSGLYQPDRESSPVILRARNRRYNSHFDELISRSNIPHGAVLDEQYHHDDVNTSRVTTDPYRAQRSQSPIRRQPRSPGSGYDATNIQSPEPRRLTTRNNKFDTLPDHHTGREVHIASDISSQFKQPTPSPEQRPRNAKRDTDGAGLDKSWVLTKPDNAAQAITHGLWGRKEHRTRDRFMHDDLHDHTAHDELRDQRALNHVRGRPTHDDSRGQPMQRQNATHGWGLPEPRRSTDRVGPEFEFDRQRFESNPREQRTRRQESPSGGATRTASQRRRSPTPCSQKEGTDFDAIESHHTDQEDTRRKRCDGAGGANRSQAESSNQAMQTPYSISQVNNPTRVIVKDLVNAWEDQRFNENGSQGRPVTYDIGENDAKHSGDHNDWYQEDNVDNGEPPRTRAASTAGSSTSLGDHKKERDLMLAALSLKKAECEERAIELKLANLDAAIVIERRSRNSSQAGSSACSHNPSNTSGSPSRSERKGNTGQEPVVVPDDPHATYLFYCANDSHSHGVSSPNVPDAGVIGDNHPEGPFMDDRSIAHLLAPCEPRRRADGTQHQRIFRQQF